MACPKCRILALQGKKAEVIAEYNRFADIPGAGGQTYGMVDCRVAIEKIDHEISVLEAQPKDEDDFCDFHRYAPHPKILDL